MSSERPGRIRGWEGGQVYTNYPAPDTQAPIGASPELDLAGLVPQSELLAEIASSQIPSMDEIMRDGKYTMSELDFDRSLPPIMPRHGDEFNTEVAQRVEQADGNEEALKEVVIDVPRQRELKDIPMIEYTVPDRVPFYGSKLRTD